MNGCRLFNWNELFVSCVFFVLANQRLLRLGLGLAARRVPEHAQRVQYSAQVDKLLRPTTHGVRIHETIVVTSTKDSKSQRHPL